MILLLSLCAYAKNPKASKSTTEAESGNASPTKARERPSILYTHTCGSGVVTYSLTAPSNRKGRFKNFAGLMCDAYDLFLSNRPPIYKNIKMESKKCEDAKKASKKTEDSLAFLKKNMKSEGYNDQPDPIKRDLRFELQRLKEKKQDMARQHKKVCNEYKEFKKTVKVPLREFEKEDKVILDRANRYLQICMNDIPNCKEENFAVWSFMATMIENPKRKVAHDAASEQEATQEQPNPNANPEDKSMERPRMNDGRFKRFMAKLRKAV
ncbi:hypothetical protein BSLG_003197 [Batrachochytrium salamandrivorans]|nr:hypothetical protein BSLG_003197 [Batrachochytrium salamandrivorans]